MRQARRRQRQVSPKGWMGWAPRLQPQGASVPRVRAPWGEVRAVGLRGAGEGAGGRGVGAAACAAETTPGFPKGGDGMGTAASAAGGSGGVGDVGVPTGTEVGTTGGEEGGMGEGGRETTRSERLSTSNLSGLPSSKPNCLEDSPRGFSGGCRKDGFGA